MSFSLCRSYEDEARRAFLTPHEIQNLMFELLLTVLRAFTKFRKSSDPASLPPNVKFAKQLHRNVSVKAYFIDPAISSSYQISTPVSVYLALVRRREHPLSGSPAFGLECHVRSCLSTAATVANQLPRARV